MKITANDKIATSVRAFLGLISSSPRTVRSFPLLINNMSFGAFEEWTGRFSCDKKYLNFDESKLTSKFEIRINMKYKMKKQKKQK